MEGTNISPCGHQCIQCQLRSELSKSIAVDLVSGLRTLAGAPPLVIEPPKRRGRPPGSKTRVVAKTAKTAPQTFGRWSPVPDELKKAIHSRAAAGMPHSQIAKELNILPKTVNRFARGVPPSKARPKDLDQAAKKSGHFYSNAEMKKVLDLYVDGKSKDEIQKITKLSHGVVNGMLKNAEQSN